MKVPPLLWIIVPCYNEEKVLPLTAPRVLEKTRQLVSGGQISDSSRILFVNDGSVDSTWDIIQALARQNPRFIGISQSRNRGQQSSLLAGLMEAKGKCDITISIDCDGQDDIDAMDEMVRKYSEEGCKVVYGVRSSRGKDSFFKRFTAESFYKLMGSMGAQLVFNHADYRLVSNEVLEAFAGFEEANLFLRGLFPLVGFKSGTVYYERGSRLAGKSHYPFAKMLALALDGVTSLSVKPLHLISLFGTLIAFVSFIGVIWSVVQVLRGKTVAGWASTTCIICFVSGVQLISLGIIGEYIGKIYMETKKRPRYIISERTY